MAANLRDEQGNPIQLTDGLGRPVQLTDEHGNPLNLSGVAYTTSEQTAYSAPPHTHTTTSHYTPAAMGGAAGTLGTALHEGGTLGEVLQAEGGDFGEGGGGGGQYQPRRQFGDVSGGGGGGGGGGVGGGVGGGQYQPRREVGDVIGGGEGGGGGGQYQPRREKEEEQPAIAALGGTGRSAEIQSTGYSPTSSEGENQEGIVEGHEGEGGTRKKKGFTEKIKDKFSGGGKHKDKDKDMRHTATTTATTTTEVTTATAVEHHGEDGNKKGVMGKIMDKIPGTHH